MTSDTPTEVVQGEVMPDEDTMPEPTSQELTRVEEEPSGQGVTLFGTNDPTEVVARAAKVATALKDILVKQRLTKRIGSNEHVQVEGWGTLGSMVGVFPVKDGPVKEIPWPEVVPPKLVEQKENGRAFGYTASYKAQTLLGAVVGGGEADCKRTESKWWKDDDYALKSMAQTRAQSKAMKAPLSFIVAMAGYEPTPAEEMDGVSFGGGGYGGEFGPPMHQGDTEKLARAMTFLINDARSAIQVKGIIEKESGGYVPRIVSRAIIHIARAARDGKQSEEQHSGDSGAPEQQQSA